MRALALIVVLVACGGTNKSPTEPDPAAATLLDCAKVAAHVAATVEASTPRPRATAAEVKGMVTTRCQTDSWSDATKQCLYEIKTVQEGRACATAMTDVQRAAIEAHARSLRASASGSGSNADDQSADWVKHVVEE